MCSQFDSQFGQDKSCVPPNPKTSFNEFNINHISEHRVRLGEISGLTAANYAASVSRNFSYDGQADFSTVGNQLSP